ncbi:hypothetical protein MLD38_038213 [Melastoma candidum]|uniref:Uncharacterized protein n=1 Tax=Melastoma candidum TaxID=119954 RepID=A0ACB9L0H8_9MYRT|nr:hypothetical protein MLD38_038213 [Melastoma candidum]
MQSQLQPALSAGTTTSPRRTPSPGVPLHPAATDGSKAAPLSVDVLSNNDVPSCSSRSQIQRRPTNVLPGLTRSRSGLSDRPQLRFHPGNSDLEKSLLLTSPPNGPAAANPPPAAANPYLPRHLQIQPL